MHDIARIQGLYSNKKKLFGFLLSIVISISLFACASEGGGTDDTASTTATTTTGSGTGTGTGATTYTITYVGNGSTSGTVPVDSSTYEQGANVTVAANSGNLFRSSFGFSGWNTAANGSGTAYAAGATLSMGTANVTLYAQWSAFSLSSSSWTSGNAIPITFAHDSLSGGAQNQSPQLSWSNIPTGTTHFAVSMIDNDANTWKHWLIYNIPVGTTTLAANISNGTLPTGATQINNSFGSGDTTGYGGPAPPPGPAHTYTITVYALNGTLNTLNASSSNSDFTTAANGQSLGTVTMTGTFSRP